MGHVCDTALCARSRPQGDGKVQSSTLAKPTRPLGVCVTQMFCRNYLLQHTACIVIFHVRIQCHPHTHAYHRGRVTGTGTGNGKTVDVEVEVEATGTGIGRNRDTFVCCLWLQHTAAIIFPSTPTLPAYRLRHPSLPLFCSRRRCTHIHSWRSSTFQQL